MKSDHRHELKANELAEWINNLPQWARENHSIIICCLVVIIAAISFFVWKIHSRNTAAQKQVELTTLVGQILGSKAQILQAYMQGQDRSFIILQPADDLKIFADNTDDDQMAAFALIKRAEAIRIELHYRMGSVNAQEFTGRINEAKASYAEALERCSTNPTLTAMAKFGIGLCEEELGNFEGAEQIYRDITASADLQGTVAAAQAKTRLETIADYKQKITFKPAPKKPAAELSIPSDARIPITQFPTDANLYADVNLEPEAPDTITEFPDINPPVQTKDSVPEEASDVNQPVK